MTTLAFWHTFGPYAGETPEEIIARKRNEINANEWTLWSFQHRTLQYMQSWIQEIYKSEFPEHLKPERVLVLCSESTGAIDPHGPEEPQPARRYKEYQNDNWQEWQLIHPKISITHSWKNNGLASAFKVSKILFP